MPDGLARGGASMGLYELRANWSEIESAEDQTHNRRKYL
jgi:hypothetical protein